MRQEVRVRDSYAHVPLVEGYGTIHHLPNWHYNVECQQALYTRLTIYRKQHLYLRPKLRKPRHPLGSIVILGVVHWIIYFVGSQHILPDMRSWIASAICVGCKPRCGSITHKTLNVVSHPRGDNLRSTRRVCCCCSTTSGDHPPSPIGGVGRPIPSR
jgi:hypothetical protein